MVVSVGWLQIITWKNGRFTERVPGHSRLNQRWRPSKLWRVSLENPGLKWTKMDYENHDQPAPSACLMYASFFCWVRGPYVIVIVIHCNYLFIFFGGGIIEDFVLGRFLLKWRQYSWSVLLMERFERCGKLMEDSTTFLSQSLTKTAAT